jgi:two-component system OmpR family response regulator
MKILVVEDEDRIAKTIKRGLEQEGWVVETVDRGDDGYEIAREGGYDVIVLDRMLPGMDGLTVSKKLRESNISTPILMLTAKTMVSDRVEGLNGGADDYLPKPFAFEELVARIRALSRRPKKQEKNTLTCADIAVDTLTYSVTRNGQEVPLSRREFMLLEYLVRNVGVVVSKEQIIEAVWDFDADVLPNTVEAHIKHLRSKLEDPFPMLPKRIQTVRGFGYTISAK